MATDINHVVLVGRLTRDAELRYSNSGTAICRFSLANSYRTKQGDTWGEDTNFFDCVMFGKRAEAVNQYLTKGTQVGVDGALRFSKWEQDGQTRSKVEVHVNEFQFLGGGRDGGGRGGGSDRSQPQYDGGDAATNDFEDDVPF